MHVKFKNTSLDLSNGPGLIGIIELDPRQPFDPIAVQDQAKEYLECGAVGVEIGICKQSLSDITPEVLYGWTQEDNTDLSESSGTQTSATVCEQADLVAAYHAMTTEQRAQILSAACKAVLECSNECVIAVYTSEPLVMQRCAEYGANLIIDPLALREEGALETISSLKINVCLCFDQCYKFDEDDNTDVCGKISEFFYERLDACINARINRNRIMLDPSINLDVGVEYRLKLQGRVKTFTSFALPLTCQMPRVFPSSDEFLRNNMSATVAVALFMAKQGFSILRTKHVYDLGLALDTWSALNFSARPFRMRNLIGRKLKAFKNKKASKQEAVSETKAN